MPFRRILVGWDCSPGAAAALRAAAALAGGDGAHVVALAVLKPAPHTEDAAEGAADFDGRQRFAEKTFAKARESLPSAQRERVSLQFARPATPRAPSASTRSSMASTCWPSGGTAPAACCTRGLATSPRPRPQGRRLPVLLAP